jgi:hypothetical protein
MSPREPSGRHATAAFDREVTPIPVAAAWQPAGQPASEQPARDPMWFRVLERYGFPTLVALALGWGFVGYNKQVREDAAKARVEFREVVDRLIKSQEEDRREMRASLTRQTQLLEQIAERLGRDDGRVAARRGGR